MTKYTDEQIKSSLELCINWKRGNCHKCDFGGVCLSSEKPLLKNALELINRQEAEIERLENGCADCPMIKAKSDTVYELNEQIEYWQRGYNDLRQEIKTAKFEATKEFAQRLKDNSQYIVSAVGYTSKVFFVDELDNFIKEMVGESK